MRRNQISRRRFVNGSVRLAVVAPLVQLAPLEALAQPARLAMAERRTLRAAAEVIIPADSRMPSAAQIGAAGYIERIASGDPTLAGLLVDGLRAIEARSMSTHTTPFEGLSADQEATVLTEIETSNTPPGFFPTLRDLVYEAYYTQPRVMKLLGYNFRSGRRRTAPVEPFDEQRVARVRNLPPFFRQLTP